MKKVLYCALILFFSLRLLNAQNCNPQGIIFSSQAMVDNFSVNFPGCSVIEGDVTIRSYGSQITNLNGLSQLNCIWGSLIIQGNSLLPDLTGLHNIDSIGVSLWIFENAGLLNLNGLQGLHTLGAGGLFISNNPALQDISGLSALGPQLGQVEICHNPALAALTGLDNVVSMSSLRIGGNGQSDLTGLGSLQNVTWEFNIGFIKHNIYPFGPELIGTSLTSLAGMGSLTNIDGNLWI